MGTVSVELRRGDCPCPGAVHPFERVDLLPALTLPLAAGALAAVNEAPIGPGGVPDVAAIQQALVGAYLPAAIVGWTFTEPDGTGGIRPVPVTRDSLERLLPWDKGGYELIQKCDSLYSARLLAPLAGLTSNASQAGPTEPSTSATPSSGQQPPEPSGPSSPTSTDGIESAAPA